MKQFNLTFLLTVLLSMMNFDAFAHDIEVPNSDGVTIYYSWRNNNTELAVSNNNSYSNTYSGSVVIPESVSYNGTNYPVTEIGSGAFEGSIGLTSVTIPNSVTIIGDYAYMGCSGLTSMVIPNSVTYIGYSAFENCIGLTSVTIGNSVQRIGTEVFHNCSNLTEVNFIATYCVEMGLVQHSLFLNCNSFTTLNIGDNVKKIPAYAFYGCSRLTNVDIPNSVTSIGDYAFAWCSVMRSATIGNSVTSIGAGAFYYCSLTSVEIPKSVKSIGNNAFSGCSLEEIHISDLDSWCNISFGSMLSNGSHHLYLNGDEIKKLVIPKSVTKIGGYAFHNCSGLTSVEIPYSVTIIGNYAFSGCSGLTSVEIPNSVTTIGDYAFMGCRNMTRVNIPNNLTDIGDCTFKGCISLSDVAIPNSVTNIGEYAFNGCSGMTNLTIGNSVTSIGYNSFASCSNLSNVYCLAPSVPNTSNDAFNNTNIESAELHVPEYAINYYKTKSPWNSFSAIVALPYFKLTYLVDGETYKTYKYEQDRIIPIEPAPEKEGYTFSGWSEIPMTMPAHDVEVIGTFVKNSVAKCATPTISFKDGKFKFESEEEGVEYVWSFNIVNNNGKGSETGTPTKFVVSVYATKENYEDSDPATMELDMRSPIGDVNGDGKVDAVDITKLVEIILGVQ